MYMCISTCISLLYVCNVWVDVCSYIVYVQLCQYQSGEWSAV